MAQLGRLAAELGARGSMKGASARAEALADRLRALNFCAFESVPFDVAVPELMRGPSAELARLLTESVRLLRTMPPLVGLPDAPAGHDEETVEDQAPEAGAKAQEGQARPPLDRFCEDMDNYLQTPQNEQSVQHHQQLFLQVRDMSLEILVECLDLLRAAKRERSKWALITAGEEGRRKATKSLRTNVILGMRIVSPVSADKLFVNEPSELQAALQVRDSIMLLRARVLTLLQSSVQVQPGDQEVRMLAAQVCQRLREFFQHPVYHYVRAADRYALQNHFGRIHGWVERLPTDEEVAIVDALEALGSTVEDLQQVNRRVILVDHDRQVRDTVLERLRALQGDAWQAPHAGDDYLQVLREAQRMQHRNLDLDNVVRIQLNGDSAIRPLEQSAQELASALAAVRLPPRDTRPRT